MAYFTEITATFRKPDGSEFTTVRDDYKEIVRSIQEQLKDSESILVSLSEAEYDDVDYMVGELTEPHEKMTITKAKKIMADAVSDGWKIPDWFTPQEFVITYKERWS